MIRLIVRTDDANMACNVGGAVETTFRTFDVNLPAVEAYIGLPTEEKWGAAQRQIVGIEFISTSFADDTDKGDGNAKREAYMLVTARINDLENALRLFLRQWNTCGPNSDFGRYFSNIRQVAEAALKSPEPPGGFDGPTGAD